MYVQKLFWATAALITAIPTVLIGMVTFPIMIYLQAILGLDPKELAALYDISNGLGAYLIIASVTGAVAYTIIIIVAVGITYELYKDKRRERAFLNAQLNPQEVVGTEPGLLTSWWHAMHDKVCPMIEFVRND